MQEQNARANCRPSRAVQGHPYQQQQQDQGHLPPHLQQQQQQHAQEPQPVQRAFDYEDVEDRDGVRLSWNVFAGSRIESTRTVVPIAAVRSCFARFPSELARLLTRFTLTRSCTLRSRSELTSRRSCTNP